MRPPPGLRLHFVGTGGLLLDAGSSGWAVGADLAEEHRAQQVGSLGELRGRTAKRT